MLIMNNNEKNDINKIIKFIKENINIENFIISKIDINTKLPYYVINVLYSEKNIKNINKNSKQLFSEYILEKNNNNILHFFTNNISSKNKSEYIEKYECNPKNILKIFYHENNWITIPEIKYFEIYLKKTFNKINDIYEILNKNFYYTYFISNEKFIFISKGEMKDLKSNYCNNEIFLENDKYIFVRNIENIMEKKDDKKCKYGLTCINPNCYYYHPENHDLNKSYKEYINKEKRKDPKFKSMFCKNDNRSCTKHKYNKCRFLHKDDPID